MTNYDLIKSFRNGATSGDGSHLYIRGNDLYNYKTVIAHRDEEGNMHLNIRWYSRTTTTLQNYCKKIFGSLIVEEYEGPECTKQNYGVGKLM